MRRPQLAKLFIFVAFLIGVTLLASSIGATKIQAQSINSWSEPQNLSQSGSANKSTIVADPSGNYHVVWSDEFAGSKYVSGDGVEWSQPVIVNLPFNNAVPKLLADKEGYIHAFWLKIPTSTDNADSTEGKVKTNPLFYSTVRAADFASSSAWTSPVQLAESALDFGITIDQNGDLHLIYIRPLDSTEFPAGAYYRKLVTGNTEWTWSSPTLIYSSPYFRSIKLEDSSADIATSTINSAIQVYAVWDNRPRESVYLATSADGGQSWNPPEEIDKPDSRLGYNSTGKILVEAYEKDILLVWQRSSSGGFCSQYHQHSHDGGVTWSQPDEVSSGSSSCSQEDQLINDGNGLIYLWSVLPTQVNLLAWDRQQWSNPQPQNELSAFTDPESQKLVIFDCRQPVMNGSQRLAVAGCDMNGGGDIWFTQRQLSDVNSWFSAQSAWSEAEEFVTSQTEIETPVLIAAPDNNLIALWSQTEIGAGSVDQAAIHLARWDGENWTVTGPILRSSRGNLTQPSAVTDGEGHLFAVWNASEEGRLYFSLVDAANADNPAEWLEPVPLPNSQALASAPKILLTEAGEIDVVYSVPLNEERGIYLTRSADNGKTWSTPLKIFDAAAANWQIVGDPQFVNTPDGGLHILWTQKSILDGGGILGVYYARSEDNGNTWSDPEVVTDREVQWSQIATLDQGDLVRVWQEGSQLRPVINYQFSQDSGRTWGVVKSFGSFGEESLMANLISDSAGNLHMLQLVKSSSRDLVLRDWFWENESWSVNEYFDLTNGMLEEAVSMESAVSSEGNLAMILSARNKPQSSNLDQYGLFFTARTLGQPVVNSAETTTPISPPTTPTENLTPIPTGISLPTPTRTTPVVQETSTSSTTTNISSGPSAPSGSSFLSIGYGVLLSTLIIIAAVVIGVWRIRSNR